MTVLIDTHTSMASTAEARGRTVRSAVGAALCAFAIMATVALIGAPAATAGPVHHSTSHRCVTKARTTACTWWVYWTVAVDSTGRNRLHVEPHVSVNSNGVDEIKTIAVQRQFIGHPQSKFPIRTDLSYRADQKGRGYLTRRLYSHVCTADIQIRIKLTYAFWQGKPVNALVAATTYGYFYNFDSYRPGSSCSPFHS